MMTSQSGSPDKKNNPIRARSTTHRRFIVRKTLSPSEQRLASLLSGLKHSLVAYPTASADYAIDRACREIRHTEATKRCLHANQSVPLSCGTWLLTKWVRNFCRPPQRTARSRVGR